MVATRFTEGTRVVERWNDVFKALSAEPRRQLIVLLIDSTADAPVFLPESAMNPNVPTDPESLRVELYHCHLPLLANLGYIERKADPLSATRGSRFEEVAAVFEALHSISAEIPETLVTGYQRLEKERQRRTGN